ncbi:glycosyltransferase family 24 protein [Aplosporella prunicola CBS 121167]|uniref:Glycosyltransferase family 24 protein n=1 Tax=Aplosporella prunicola CBS 121167 TaxID=1176127 RepID=A0A6A6BSH9_9PEZI|nr:glycosyltransferase family 24 protein [Aplosporella prunicola CBS 121167]KAF2147059.1 glycosyltransferase family 24 protein [Aplosporella prunicola CBS 121167]
MRVHPWLLSSHTALLLSTFSPLRVGASPPINVALRASFNAPPYLVELLETAAQENATAYYPLLDRIADGYFDGQATEKELYDAFLQLLQDDAHITDADSLSSFQFALSIHSAAPRIEAHYQFYNTSVEPSLKAAQGDECEAWVLLEEKQYCRPELDKSHGTVAGARTELLPFDRILGDAERQIPFILYADITSPSFRAFHKTVSKSAKEGKASYKLRHKPSKTAHKGPLDVSGYGVELALKRTDYIVIDDRQADEAGRETGAEPLQSSLQDQEVADLKPLSESELKGLGLKAASFVMNSENPLDTLVKLSQDFPKHSSAISAHNVTKEFLEEHKGNRAAILPPGFNILWINGVQIMPRDMDAFAMLEHLRKERGIINSVRNLGFSSPEAISVLSHKAISEASDKEEPQRYDFRDEIEGGKVIIWLNDIEKDKRYAQWPKTLQGLLQPTYPGVIPQVRKDIMNTIMPIDLSEPKDVALVIGTLQSMVKRKLAVHWGLVPVMTSQAAVEQAKVVYHLLDTYGLSVVMNYLQASLENRQLSSPHQAVFDMVIKGAKLRRDRVARDLEEILMDEEVQKHVEAANSYLTRLGADASSTPPMFVNGVALARGDDWLQSLSMRVSADLQMIQKAVYEGSLDDDVWVPSVFLNDASPRRNPFVIPEDEKEIRFLNIAQVHSEHGALIDGLPKLPAEEDSKWFQWAQLVVLADLNNAAGSKLAKEAFEFRREHGDVEVVIVHTGKSIPDATWARDIDDASGFFAKLVNGKHIGSDDFLSNEEGQAEATKYWQSVHPLIPALGCKDSTECLLLNGRTIGPLPKSRVFSREDFEALLSYERKKRIEPAARAVMDLEMSSKLESPAAIARFNSLVALSTVSDIPEGIFDAPPTMRRQLYKLWNSTYTSITTGDVDTATIQIVASIDPASEVAQRWIPMLKVLSQLNGVHTRLFLNPKERLDELPVKRFYRYVLDSKPSFGEDGSSKTSQAHFTGIPSEALLTVGMDVRPSWLVAPKDCIHDLDNIKLSTFKGVTEIDALYELESVLIEGHSRDTTISAYPRGTQLDLKTGSNPRYADTIIMANIGYFQFKANPGLYSIELQPGRSQDIYNFDSAGTQGWNPSPGDETKEIALISFQGLTLYPRLSRKPGMEEEDVLSPTTSGAADLAAKGAKFADDLLAKMGIKGAKTGKILSQGMKLGSSLLSLLGLSTDTKAAKHADINIFSVASGHLYERMLNIMMLSVMKHTEHTVKFWFIEQFLSPSFKSFLPTLAEEYGFQYEMVTYKWPHWLRGQKEKQREIWGYKILFLDVLFPLDLDKVIFVDADQIVRTDMYELVQHDLQGAPYGFTPMCDSRTEMEGFRFWKQGYWKNFLRGLPYHISALYVVDLQRFRELAAGDRLRQQYHQLSADPNSLSNLDQDLPNNMQMQLPIHSLPQEWLWCETWCSDESLRDAKTIDLCNNPQTKEPKLDRARRQVPEWTVYDEEIAAVARKTRGKDDAEARAPVGERDREILEEEVRGAEGEEETERVRDEL